MSKDADLQKEQLARYNHFTKIAKDNQKGMVLTIEACCVIRQEKLYLTGGFKSFEQWVEANLDVGLSQIKRLTNAYSTQKMLKETTGEEVVTTPPNKVCADNKGSPKGPSLLDEQVKVSSAASPAASQEKESPVLDAEGNELKFEARKFWARRLEVREVVEQVTELKNYLEATIDRKDPLWHGINHQELEMVLDELKNVLRQAMPYAICTQCYGAPSSRGGRCGFCGNKGLINKIQWDVMVPQETKAIMAKSKGQK